MQTTRGAASAVMPEVKAVEVPARHVDADAVRQCMPSVAGVSIPVDLRVDTWSLTRPWPLR